MIKLIASDLDGTLLDENKQLPKEFPQLIEYLDSKNINFTIASGRSYTALTHLFNEKYLKKLNFICDNGAYIVRAGKTESVSIIEKQTVNKITEICKQLENTSPVLCGMKDIYYEKSVKEQFSREINNFYINFNAVDDISAVEDDIFKISVCDIKNPLKNSFPRLTEYFGDSLTITVSGDCWLDIMNKDINKGSALADIQKMMNVGFDETMAFGDFYNDVPMLEKSYYSFVMENAGEDMKKYGRFIAPPNTENGVIRAIYRTMVAHDGEN